jgi:hypothetical protein
VTVIYQSGDFVFGSSVTAGTLTAGTLEPHLLVVVVARFAPHHEGAGGATGFAHEVAFVAKTGIAVRAQAKLELIALLGALFLREVHVGNVNVRGLFFVVVLGILGFKHRFVTACD